MRAPVLLATFLIACSGGASGAESSESSSGSDSAGESSDSSTPDPTLPLEISESAFAAFIEAELYKGEGWQAETETPRDASDIVTPHGRVRVFLHDTTVAAQAAGRGTVAGPPLPPGSAAVKEMYDADDQLVGTAMLYKHLEGDELDAAAYWCFGPEERCTTVSPAYPADAPLFGPGSENDCGGCHTGLVFTQLP